MLLLTFLLMSYDRYNTRPEIVKNTLEVKRREGATSFILRDNRSLLLFLYISILLLLQTLNFISHWCKPACHWHKKKCASKIWYRGRVVGAGACAKRFNRKRKMENKIYNKLNRKRDTKLSMLLWISHWRQSIDQYPPKQLSRRDKLSLKPLENDTTSSCGLLLTSLY